MISIQMLKRFRRAEKSDQHLNTPFKNKQEMITNEKFQILLI